MEIFKNSKVLLTVCGTIVILVLIMAVSSGYKATIEAEREITRTKIEAEKTVKQSEIVEKESTSRTGERSQFWQKLVPWGDYQGESKEQSNDE